MDNEAVKKILSELEAGYDLIADKFSSTRAFMWRDFGFAKDLVKPCDRVLDFGCGNGRLAEFILGGFGELGREGRLSKSGEYVGVDVSQKLINIARENNQELSSWVEFLKIDPLAGKLPFGDNSFDAVFSIAVFHHFPSKDYRLQMARELYRVLRPGGKLVVSVWNLWQKRFWKYHLRFDLKNLKRSNLENRLGWKYLYIPFKNEEQVFQRYHHAFTKRELKKLFLESGFKKIYLVESNRGNIIFVAEK